MRKALKSPAFAMLWKLVQHESIHGLGGSGQALGPGPQGHPRHNRRASWLMSECLTEVIRHQDFLKVKWKKKVVCLPGVIS